MPDLPASTSSVTERKVTPASAPATGVDTVCVGLKHPNGIVLQAYEMVETGEVTPQGYRTQMVARQVGEPFTLHGNAVDVRALLGGVTPEHLIIEGFAITSGVPSEVWKSWLEANKTGMLVRNNLIFEAKDEIEARAKAKARGMLKSGLEPIDPNDPGTRFGMGAVQQGTRAA